MRQSRQSAGLCLLAVWLLLTPGSWGQDSNIASSETNSKNSQPSSGGLPGLTYAQSPVPSSKNFADHGPLLQASPSGAAGAGPPGSAAFACGASENLDWSTTAGSFQVIHQCDLTVPQDGYVFISADGSLSNADGEYEAQFSIDIDAVSGDGDTDRWVNVYNDSGDGSDRSVALSVLKSVGKGVHTVYFLGRRFSGGSTVTVFDPTLTAVFVPLGGACGASGDSDWTSTSGTFEVVRQCDLVAPQDGYLFISTDASLANLNGEYEAQFRIDIDTTDGDGDIDRWVNVFNDSGDGSDKSVALSVLKPVTQGMHTVYALGMRSFGAATVLALDPTLTAVFVPLEGACGASGNANWTTTSSTFEVARQCSLDIAADGFVFISADGTLFRPNGSYEGHLGVDIDSTSGDLDVDRWVNIYDGSTTGRDESFRLSVRKQVTAGSHTIYLLGSRESGPQTGTVGVFDSTLTAWSFGIFVFGDGFESSDTSAWTSAVP